MAVAAFFAWRGLLRARPPARPPAVPVVAVLPFKSLGPPEDQYFADGLTEEITSRLAGVGGLRVISRTSAEQYRASAKPLREIGAALGATYVLEGSVRWERSDTGKGRVRVTPQLIRVSARLAAARRMADSALTLVPDLPEGRLALGLYHYWGFFDYPRALVELEAARLRQPSNSYILAVMAFINRRLGQWETAAALMKEALRLDPLMDARAFDLGDIYMRMRRYPEAEQQFDKAIALGPDWSNTRAYKAMLYVVWQGDMEKARAVYREALTRIAAARLFGQVYTAERISGAVVTADSGLRRHLEEVTAGTFAGDSGRYHLLKAEAAWFGGDDGARVAHADSARRTIEAAFRAAPRDGRLLSRLGVIYSFLGRHEEAVRTGRRAVELLPLSRDADSGPFLVSNLARSYMLAGQADSAIALLRSLGPASSWITPAELRADPTWDPLRDHPRFRELMATNAASP